MIDGAQILEILRAVAPYAGLGGISVVLVISVFQGIVKKEVLLRLTGRHAYHIVRLGLWLTFWIGIAGICAWLVTATIQSTAPKEISPLKPSQQPPYQLPQSHGEETEQSKKPKQPIRQPVRPQSGVTKDCKNIFSGGTNNGSLTQVCP